MDRRAKIRRERRNGNLSWKFFCSVVKNQSSTVYKMLRQLLIVLKQTSESFGEGISNLLSQCTSQFVNNFLTAGFYSLMFEDDLSFLDENSEDVTERARKLAECI